MFLQHFTVTAVATASIAIALGYFVLVEAKRQTGALKTLGKIIGLLVVVGVTLISILRFIKVFLRFL
jgi:hypothetical protein